MADLFKLVGSIFIDNDEANKSISKTDEKAQGLGKTLLNGAKNVGKFAAGLGTAAAGAATALTKMASDSASALDVVDKASQRMGVSAESYQELAHAANLSGVEMSALEQAAKNLEGKGLGLDEALNQVMALSDETERSALAVELFGSRAAYSMTPMLNAGTEGMAEMRQEAHDLGLVFSQDTVSAGAELNDMLSRVKDAFAALVTGLGASLMPIITKVCGIILEYLPMIQGLFDRLAPVLVGLLETLLPMLLDIVDEILPFAMDILIELVPVFEELCQTILPILVELVRALMPVLKALLPLVEPLLDLVMVFLEPLLQLIEGLLPGLMVSMQKVAEFTSKYVGPAIEAVVGWIVGQGGIIGILEKLGAKVGEIFTGIKNTIKGAINGVLSFISGLVNGIINGINVMIRAMNKLSFSIPDWVPGLGGKKFGFNLSELRNVNIPLLAEGAVIEPNKPFAAVLGDQKQGTNIEAPLSTIKQAVSEVMQNVQLNLNLNVEADEAGIFKITQRQARLYTESSGLPAF